MYNRYTLIHFEVITFKLKNFWLLCYFNTIALGWYRLEHNLSVRFYKGHINLVSYPIAPSLFQKKIQINLYLFCNSAKLVDTKSLGFTLLSLPGRHFLLSSLTYNVSYFFYVNQLFALTFIKTFAVQFHNQWFLLFYTLFWSLEWAQDING